MVSQTKTQTAVAVAVLGAAVWLVYGQAVHAPLVFDDAGSVLENESIRRLWPLVGTAERRGPLNPPPLTSTSGRPLVNLSLAVNYHFGGLEPTGYHVLNLAFHWLSSLLLLAVVRRTLRLPYFAGRFDDVSGVLALAAALLWAVHPLNTEAVIYVTQRTEQLMALCYLATLYCSLRYWSTESQTTRAAWLTLAVCASAAGMASKEVMVSAPLVVLLFERTFLAGSLVAAWRRSWPLYVGLATTWMLLLALNVGGPRSESAGFHLGVPAHAWWFTQAKVLLMYLKLAVWPWPLVIHYEMPYLDTFHNAWPYVVPVALLVAGTLILLWRNLATGFLAAAVFAILSPTLVVPITTEVAAERRMYLPLAAFVVFAVCAAYTWLQSAGNDTARDSRKRDDGRPPLVPVAAAALLLAIVYGVVSAHRLAAYRDPLLLWQQAVTHQPLNSVAQQNLAASLAASGRHQEAVDHYREALKSKPEMVEAHYNLGLVLASIGQFDEAIEHLRTVVRLKPKLSKTRNNLGVVLFTAGRYSEAAEEFRQALERNPDMVEAREGLARALEAIRKAPPPSDDPPN